MKAFNKRASSVPVLLDTLLHKATMNFGKYSLEPEPWRVVRPRLELAERRVDFYSTLDASAGTRASLLPSTDTFSRRTGSSVRRLPINYCSISPTTFLVSPEDAYSPSAYLRVQRSSDRHDRRKKKTASLVEARVKWMERGYQLLKRNYEGAVYSVKVFLGGLQYDTTSQSLERLFQELCPVRVQKSTREGHAYLIFENSESVAKLLSQCENLPSGEHFLLVGNRKAQVIPWALQEIEWGIPLGRNVLSRPNTIFVGGLHGETTAEHLKIIMEDRFGQVQHVLIDTDKYMYPSGSGQVQFVFRPSFLSAIEANFLEINTKHYSRTVQLEPFFEKGRSCCRCLQNFSTSLCRFLNCLDYYCKSCFEAHRREQGQLYYLHREVGLS